MARWQTIRFISEPVRVRFSPSPPLLLFQRQAAQERYDKSAGTYRIGDPSKPCNNAGQMLGKFIATFSMRKVYFLKLSPYFRRYMSSPLGKRHQLEQLQLIDHMVSHTPPYRTGQFNNNRF